MKKILEIDPYLAPYAADLEERSQLFKKKREELLAKDATLSDFANGHLYFGFHCIDGGLVYREWAPGADSLYLTGDFCDWELYACPMQKKENGVFELYLASERAPKYGQRVQTVVVREGKVLRRVPVYATRVVQDPKTFLWCAELEDTLGEYPWTDGGFTPEKTPLIYEAHIGMAQEKGEVGTYAEFAEGILPRIKAAGYNTLQLMAIMEHPYYGSFGYQVSSFFAASSRFGKSSELKALINKAHEMGIAVLLDLVHSHAVKNTAEGIGEFDGTPYQFFHEGKKGLHPAWDTRLFNYGKNEVLHFLLSNLKYWLTVFHFDGFRFDGVTSMLYNDHGLGKSFTDYGKYFSENTDKDAVVYLQLANELVHTVKPAAVTVAEDMSGMPGMCLPIRWGGIGFDFRLSMGVPDFWIQMLKERRDEDWDMWALWHELTQRRPKEKNIGYAESHDQALVGDKTIMFRLSDANMYTDMSKNVRSIAIDRGIALHKMIRLITATLAGEGYLNFMGNEFGHPEWIDFPREGNGWSYHYCRRQWSLVDDKELRYSELDKFDKDMIVCLKRQNLLSKCAVNKWISNDDKVIVYAKGNLIFAFNFHPTKSHEGYFIPVDKHGEYRVILSTDERAYGGFERADAGGIYKAEESDRGTGFLCYLPTRTALVFKRKRQSHG